MLCKPLVIIHVRVKSYIGVQKWSVLAQKVGMAHAKQDNKNSKFQVSAKINEFLLYNKK